MPDKGFLLIDKTAGITSFDVIRRLRKLTGIRRIGHCGTLDPFATGLLICALGSYTRLIGYLEALDKSYEATVLLGKSTSTGDPEGEINQISPVNTDGIDPENLKAAALALKELPIPIYSAVKISGKRAYTLARAGEQVILDARPTTIHDFRVTSQPGPDDPEPALGYRCTVSKGTYIRSLSEWIARQLDTVGYTTSLKRVAIGAIDLNEAISLEALTPDNWADYLCSPLRLFRHLEIRPTSSEELVILARGQSLSDDAEDNPTVLIGGSGNDLAGVAERSEGKLHPRINLR